MILGTCKQAFNDVNNTVLAPKKKLEFFIQSDISSRIRFLVQTILNAYSVGPQGAAQQKLYQGHIYPNTLFMMIIKCMAVLKQETVSPLGSSFRLCSLVRLGDSVNLARVKS